MKCTYYATIIAINKIISKKRVEAKIIWEVLLKFSNHNKKAIIKFPKNKIIAKEWISAISEIPDLIQFIKQKIKQNPITNILKGSFINCLVLALKRTAWKDTLKMLNIKNSINYNLRLFTFYLYVLWFIKKITVCLLLSFKKISRY